MLDNVLDFAHLGIWIVQSLYFVGLIPQMIVNYKLKSSRGLNDLMLSGYFVGYIFALFYIYLLDLPLAYKIMVPFASMAIAILVYQRFHYACYDGSKRSFIKLFGSILLVSLVVVFFVLKYCNESGSVCGWISFTVWTVYQIPQAIKIYVNKSTHGFSFVFIAIMGLGVTLEFIFSVVLRLPWPTIFSCLRGMLTYSIFCMQFLLYKFFLK